MKNVMVCVTQQKTCDRLIKYGHELIEEDAENNELFIIHVAPKDFKFLGNSQEGEALDYLFEKALEYGANLTVIRSNNILNTLVDLVNKNNIDTVVLGEAGRIKNSENLIMAFENKVKEQVDVKIVPSAG